MRIEQQHAMNEATLVNTVCILSGELLECYQWQEETMDSSKALAIIKSMQDTLLALEQTITK